MATYVVFRKGSNSSNQPMQEIAPLFAFEAKNRKEAEAILDRMLRDGDISCYNNQVCFIKHKAHTSEADFRECLLREI